MWISTRDHARFGYLFLRRGKWKDRQLISESWVRRITIPTPQQPTYGYMNFYPNTDRKLFPSAPATSVFLLGNGTNAIWIDHDHDMVTLLRWIRRDAVDGFVRRLLEAVNRTGPVTAPTAPQ
jgi:CubicO group peptidase (beta-lactamase class C family)